MDDKLIARFIGCAIAGIVIYYILQFLYPFLMAGIVGLLIYRFYLKPKL